MSKTTLAAVAEAAAETLAPEANASAAPPALASAPAAPAPVAGAIAVEGIGPAGVTAQAALELLATGHPSLKTMLDPLIASAKAGDNEAVFGRKVLASVASGQAPVVIASGKPDNAVEQPEAPKPAAASSTDTKSVYAGRAEAMAK